MRSLKKLALYSTFFCSGYVGAVEVAPGDYTQFADGTTIGLLYYEFSTTHALKAQGHTVSHDYNVDSNIGMLRFLHAFKISEHSTLDPQFLLPFGNVSTRGNASSAGSASGTGDLILTMPLKIALNDTGDVFAVSPYVYVPTGNYNHNDALNLGENRWKFDVQTAYIKFLSDKWAVDTVGDAIWYGNNNKFGSDEMERQQKMSWAAQVIGRYFATPTLSFGLGVGQTWGGEDVVEGQHQADQGQTTNVRFTATKFVTPHDQIMAQMGRDLAAQNGPEESFRMNLRYAHIF